jgi:hypothetical protein
MEPVLHRHVVCGNDTGVENHIGAIKFFICHYNLEKAAALPV